MFLDDKLFKILKEAKTDTPEDIQILYSNLCNECYSYYKSRMHEEITGSELKTLLLRTFSLWGSFVRMALKEGGGYKILGELFQKNSFKNEFLSDEKTSEIWNKL